MFIHVPIGVLLVFIHVPIGVLLVFIHVPIGVGCFKCRIPVNHIMISSMCSSEQSVILISQIQKVGNDLWLCDKGRERRENTV